MYLVPTSLVSFVTESFDHVPPGIGLDILGIICRSRLLLQNRMARRNKRKRPSPRPTPRPILAGCVRLPDSGTEEVDGNVVAKRLSVTVTVAMGWV